MKVLFAVNDENISTSIVKKYQKQYKEIISYKNVYYFNAILKELQRNKSYDRVVISEDLEEFTSSSLEQKDKFIFDRLDNISDEAVASDGSDIPIILICSERRTKSEDILVKLFGIGIYNAIIGEDRSTEEVCRLINKPRSKKEAKIYYRIDSENVIYEKESESDVSEIEMQNILMHFKKLGKNEDRYVESFHNIVSQYNDVQLKVIIAVLPNNVKEVLAENSPEYQRIMYSGGRSNANKTTITRNTPTKKVKSTTKGTSEKLLETETSPILARPVVVPTTMEKSMYTKVNTKKKIDIDLDELEDEEDLEENIQKIQKTEPKRRGRPKKNQEKEAIEVKQVEEETKPKRRGRPRKNPLPVKEEPEEEEELINVLPGFEEDDEDDDLYEYDEETETINPSRSIKKNNNTSVLPGLEDYDEEDDDYEEEEYQDELEDEYNSYEDETENTFIPQREKQYNNTYRNEIYTGKTQEMKKYDNIFEEGEFESLLTGDKKVATFIGTSKNGTSFIVNNIAQILSNMGINTAILDATQNKNAYYIYTKNDEDLRRTAVDCFGNLMKGRAEGIKVNNNLTVYTSIPSQNEQINNSHPIIETLVRNHSLVLIDCDFTTPVEYFDKSQEIYLIQSMDVLTIQTLTEFLRELKIKNALGENKIRIILNKILRVKGVNGKNIVGGMSNYNDPEMSFMTELFDRNTVKIAGQLPFDEDVYAKYLENLIECEIKLNGYPKEFRTRLATLAEVIYPLLPNNNVDKKVKKKSKKENNQYSGSFSSGMNNTLDNMRKKY
jgi:hypothetical protein